MITWVSLWAFAFLLPLIGAVVWRIIERRKKVPTVQFSSIMMVKKVSTTWRTQLRGLPMLFKVAALILAIIALARPQRADTKIKKNVEGIDIMMVLDVSDSMLIEDMRPSNRMEASKQMIKEFIKKRTSDRIGLVVFSGESYTRVPLTMDYPMLLQNLSEVKTSRNIKMGTAIGVALANGVARLKDSTAKSRVLILLTDGENNSGTIDPETSLEIAKGFGIRIYTIGAGQDGEAQLPVYTQDPFGRVQKRYQPIHSTVNDELLGKLASETGGKYYRATTGQALQNVFSAINRLEKTKIDINQYTKYAELFPPWLLAAFWLYVFGHVLAQTIFRRAP